MYPSSRHNQAYQASDINELIILRTTTSMNVISATVSVYVDGYVVAVNKASDWLHAAPYQNGSTNGLIGSR